MLVISETINAQLKTNNSLLQKAKLRLLNFTR